MKVGLAKNVLVTLGSTAVVSATDATDFWFWERQQLIKSLEDSGSLIKSITKTVENEVKEQKGVFLDMLTATLVTNL